MLPLEPLKYAGDDKLQIALDDLTNAGYGAAKLGEDKYLPYLCPQRSPIVNLPTVKSMGEAKKVLAKWRRDHIRHCLKVARKVNNATT